MKTESIINQSKEIEPYLVQTRRFLHQIPELGGEEKKTHDFLVQELKGMGIEIKTSSNHYGIIALIKGEKEGKTIGLRADMDALPIEEKSDVNFQSLYPGKMHACGHDAHMAIALGVAKILEKNKKHLKGNVKIFFEPSEETTGGAKEMVKEGCMENPKVKKVIGLHMCPDYPVGSVFAKAGAMSGASDDVRILVKGKAAHGAYPERGIDAIVLAAQIITALQTVVSRNTSPLDSVVLSIGTIHGGVAGNVICDEVILEGTLRTLSNETRKKMKEKIPAICEGIVKGLGGEVEVTLQDSYEPIYNDAQLFKTLTTIAEEVVGKDKVLPREFPSLGVESFGFFLKEAKGCYYDLGCGVGEALHTCNFTIDEKVLSIGVALQTLMAKKILEEE